MVNHDHNSNCTIGFCNLRLEKETDQTVLESKGYRQYKNEIYLGPMIGENYELTSDLKSHLLKIVEITGKVQNDRHKLTPGEEVRLALLTFRELLERTDVKIPVWDLPYLYNIVEKEHKKSPSKYEGPESPEQPVKVSPAGENPFKDLLPHLGPSVVSPPVEIKNFEDDIQRFKKWYSLEDPDANFIMFNKANKVIPAGSQITFLYSEYGNMDLCLAYGFALSENRFDWLRWRQEKEGTLKWRLYMHTLCMDGIRGIRMLIMRTGRTDKFEIETMLLTTYTNSVNKMLSHLKRSDAQTQKILDNPKISHHQKNIVLVERSWKQILLEHVRMMKYLTAVLEKVKANPTGDFKQMYMETVPGVDAEQDPEGLLKVELRHKVREYLKELNEAIPLPKAS